MTDPSRMLRIKPNSFSISKITKKEGCRNKNIESPIASGANINEEIETPSKVLLICKICSMKLSITERTCWRDEETLGTSAYSASSSSESHSFMVYNVLLLPYLDTV